MVKFFSVFLITLILGILETTAVSYPLLFLWVVCLAMIFQEKQSFWLAFLSGLWLDFLKGGVLGETALVFLGFSMLVSLYKRKFKVEHPFYFFPFVALSVLVWEIWEIRGIGGFRVFWSLVMAMGLFKLAQGLRGKRHKMLR